MTNRGYSALELLLVISITVVVGGAAIPLAHGSVDRTRASGAARYVAGRMTTARVEAIRRSASVAIRFVQQNDGFSFRTYVDGNRNGVLSSDIARGLDVPLTQDERLEHHFPGVTFGILPGVTGLDPGQPFNAHDPVQIGSSTLFIRGVRGTQFAVRVLGATGRTRVLEFNFGDQTWRTQ